MPDQRILILATKTGGGHWSPALAVSESIDKLTGGAIRVDVLDGLNSEAWVGTVIERGYSLLIRRAKPIWGSFFSVTNHRITLRLSRELLSRLVDHICDQINAGPVPEIIVCTNSVLPDLVNRALRRQEIKIPIACVITDMVTVHKAWAHPAIDLILSPSSMATQNLERLGVPKGKIVETGLPISRDFRPASRTETHQEREALGLDPLKPVVMLMNGAEGHNRLRLLSTMMDDEYGSSVQQIIVCGKNKHLLEKFQEDRTHHKKVFGFTSQVSRLIRSSDMLVTKAGSLTISEALACACPLIISESLPGQESGTAEWLSESGAALMANTPTSILKNIELLVSNHHILAAYQARAHQLGKPEAASLAAETILRSIGVGINSQAAQTDTHP